MEMAFDQDEISDDLIAENSRPAEGSGRKKF